MTIDRACGLSTAAVNRCYRFPSVPWANSSAHCATVATSVRSIQRVSAANQPVAASGFSCCAACPYARIDQGSWASPTASSFPTIITAHITNTSEFDEPPRTDLGIIKPMLAESSVSHVHAAHVHIDSKPEHVSPGQNSHHNERNDDYGTIPPQYGLSTPSAISAQRAIPSWRDGFRQTGRGSENST